MTLEIVTTKTKIDIIKNRPLNNELPHITVLFTDAITDCLPDSKIKKTIDDFIVASQCEMNETGTQNYVIPLANTLPFHYLRTQLNDQKIGDLKFIIDGVCYDIILPNGKMVGFEVRKEHSHLFLHEKYLREIL